MKYWDGQPPNGFSLNEYFDVKIQIAGKADHILLYSKDKALFTYISPTNCTNCEEIYNIVNGYKPYEGRKCFFRAKVVKNGLLFISSTQLFSRTW